MSVGSQSESEPKSGSRSGSESESGTIADSNQVEQLQPAEPQPTQTMLDFLAELDALRQACVTAAEQAKGSAFVPESSTDADACAHSAGSTQAGQASLPNPGLSGELGAIQVDDSNLAATASQDVQVSVSVPVSVSVAFNEAIKILDKFSALCESYDKMSKLEQARVLGHVSPLSSINQVWFKRLTSDLITAMAPSTGANIDLSAQCLTVVNKLRHIVNREPLLNVLDSHVIDEWTQFLVFVANIGEPCVNRMVPKPTLSKRGSEAESMYASSHNLGEITETTTKDQSPVRVPSHEIWAAAKNTATYTLLSMIQSNQQARQQNEAANAKAKWFVSRHKYSVVYLCIKLAQEALDESKVRPKLLGLALNCLLACEAQFTPLDKMMLFRKVLMPLVRVHIRCLSSNISLLDRPEPTSSNAAQLLRKIDDVSHGSVGHQLDQFLTIDSSFFPNVIEFTRNMMHNPKSTPEVRSACVYALGYLRGYAIELFGIERWNEHIVGELVIPSLQNAVAQVRLSACNMLRNDMSVSINPTCSKLLLSIANSDPELDCQIEALLSLRKTQQLRETPVARCVKGLIERINQDPIGSKCDVLLCLEQLKTIAELHQDYCFSILSDHKEFEQLKVIFDHSDDLQRKLPVGKQDTESEWKMIYVMKIVCLLLKFESTIAGTKPQPSSSSFFKTNEKSICNMILKVLDPNQRNNKHPSADRKLLRQALELANQFTSNELDTNSWFLFKSLAANVKFNMVDSETFKLVAPIIYNLISKNFNLFSKDRGNYDLLHDTCAHVVQQSGSCSQQTDESRAYAMKLLEVAIIRPSSQAKDSIRAPPFDHVRKFMELAISTLREDFNVGQQFEDLVDDATQGEQSVQAGIVYTKPKEFIAYSSNTERARYKSQVLQVILASIADHGCQAMQVFEQIPDGSVQLPRLLHSMFDKELREDMFWPHHECRLQIRAICKLMKAGPAQLTPCSSKLFAAKALLFVLDIFDNLHYAYEDHLNVCGDTKRRIQPQASYLSWAPECDRIFKTRIDSNETFVKEIQMLSRTTDQLHKSHPDWYKQVHNPLSRPQLATWDELQKYAKDEAVPTCWQKLINSQCCQRRPPIRP